MNSEIKRRALELLEKQCPDELDLHFVNVAMESSACKGWVDSIIKDIYKPQYYTFVELLYSLDTRSEMERIEAARRDFIKHGKSSDNRKKYWNITASPTKFSIRG